MSELELAQDTAIKFLKKTLNLKEAIVIRAAKTGGGWEITAEVYEESSFIKALGLHTRVQDKNIYAVKLNGSMEVESYGRNGCTAAAG